MQVIAAHNRLSKRALFFHTATNPERQSRLLWLFTVPLETQTPSIFHLSHPCPKISYHSCPQILGILYTRHRARPSTGNFSFFLIHNSEKKRVLFPQLKKCCLGAKSYLTLLNPMDCSLPGSSIHGISQERKLEWVAISFSRGSSWLRD